ncbi:2-amino-4-deoxychorismate dehydrogenase [Neomoorella glycerini]|uniref:2-amino-4-deoxychorismate dehydrogenase n=1 Tax=Neomoorella glycerini TaxID=55779 RepID=A0A6I5ZT72_9FIRM|nr:flavodoxin family protein [Moorella glycerini]QGP93323.1 2-amino-4-deoxychorismate dehydrogenase [Moorella glycerini]
MQLLYISGSPRSNSNTEYLLHIMREITGGKIIKLVDYKIKPCRACQDCRGKGECTISDEMQDLIIPELLQCEGIVLGTPVYFNNVSAQLKMFMDRTHCLIGLLKNKIGGAVAVGRRYGIEGAISALNGFFLKHEMIPANRGIYGFAFRQGEIDSDKQAIKSAEELAQRFIELHHLLHR